MDERPFLDKTNRPNDATLRAALGDTWPSCERLLAMGGGFQQSWNHSKRGGWLLKVADRTKALFYLTPLRGGFDVGLTVRPAEREALLGDTAVAGLHGALVDAKKYSEGFALRFHVRNSGDATALEGLLPRIVALRARPMKTKAGTEASSSE